MKIRFFILLVLISTALLFGCAPLREESAILISPESFDFGTIVQSDGVVSTTFSIENTGDEALTINRLSTSCGCTTAEMDMSDIAAGEQRTMTVTFDPTVHEDQTGEITRLVYLQTSDAIRPEVEIDLTAYVTK